MTNKELVSKFLVNKAPFFLGLVNGQSYTTILNFSMLLKPLWTDSSTRTVFDNIISLLSNGLNLPNSFWHIYKNCFKLNTQLYTLPLCVSLIANNHRLVEIIDEKNTNSYLDTIPYYTNPLVLKNADFTKDGMHKVYESYIDYINNPNNQDGIIEVLSEVGLLEEYQSSVLDKTKLGILLCAMINIIKNEVIRSLG